MRHQSTLFIALAISVAASSVAQATIWTEDFGDGTGRFDQTQLLGDSLFTWDGPSQRIHAEFRRNGASDRRATLLGTSFNQGDVFGFSVVVTPLDRDPGSNLSIEGKIGFFNSNDNNIDNAIGIVLRDDFQRFRLFGPGIDSGFRPVAWDRFQTYFLDFLYDGPAGTVSWSVYEGTSDQGVHLGTFVDAAPPIAVDMLGIGGDGGGMVSTPSYDGYLRAGIDDFSLTVPAPSTGMLLTFGGARVGRRRR